MCFTLIVKYCNDHSFNFHVFVFHRLSQVELQILDSETDWEKSVRLFVISTDAQP